MTDGPQQLTGYPLRDYDDLIARLGESRRTQGMSQHALARAAHVGHQQLGKWLTGSTWPLAPNLVAVVEALGYDLALIPRRQPAAEAAECGCPVTRTQCRVVSHTQECSDRQAIDSILNTIEWVGADETAPETALSASVAAEPSPAGGTPRAEVVAAISARKADDRADVARRIAQRAEHRPMSLGGDGLGYGPCVGCAELWPCPTSRDERKADTCVHCGGPQRGYGAITPADGDPIKLCHPVDGLDCYTLVTVHGHPAPCATCMTRGGQGDFEPERKADQPVDCQCLYCRALRDGHYRKAD